MPYSCDHRTYIFLDVSRWVLCLPRPSLVGAMWQGEPEMRIGFVLFLLYLRLRLKEQMCWHGRTRILEHTELCTAMAVKEWSLIPITWHWACKLLMTTTTEERPNCHYAESTQGEFEWHTSVIPAGPHFVKKPWEVAFKTQKSTSGGLTALFKANDPS